MTTTDFFDTRTKTDRLIDWAMKQNFIKTSDVYRLAPANGWGNRAVRNLQDYAEHNPDKIRRLTDKERERHFTNAVKEGVWLVIK